MNNIHLSNKVGQAATATVLGHSAFGEPVPLSEQIEVLHEFSKSMLNNVKDIDPEFSDLVDEKFWDLL